jgi:DNA-binding LacI/PurR family transcriptional regulator
MQSGSITIKDIAKALDLSYSTVSRALKGSYKISEPVIKKVCEYAEAHNYRPNLMAQGLKNNRSRSIGVILCAIPNNFYAEVINGIDSVAESLGYHVIITQSHESYQHEMKNLEQLSLRSVDGFLVSVSNETENMDHFKKLHDKGVPIVFFDRVTDLINTHQVVADNAGGSYQLTKHLIESGFKRIAHITSSPSVSITKERLEGYVNALKENVLPIDLRYIKYCLHGGMIKEEIKQAMEELIALEEKPDAIITASDRLTIGCFSFLHNSGFKIPNEIAIAGFSNFSAPELFNPSLTTIKQPAFEIGKTATELLINLIESKKPVTKFERKVLATELFVRNSTTKTQF